VRVEALLALGERAEALRWLDALALDDGPRSRELLVLRGELRAAASRCSEAVKDLGRVLTPEPTDAVDERALFARASCFTKLHQFSAARADLQRYEARFPDAARAAEAEHILRSLR
jgi:Flp pilus assembly protein TadD